MPRPSPAPPRRRRPCPRSLKLVAPASASPRSGPRAKPPTRGKVQLLRRLSVQVEELREMNVDILTKAAFIQAALDTLLTIHAGVDAGTRELYASYFFSSRETIAAGMRHLGMQQALEDFLNKAQLPPEQDEAAAA